MRKDAALKITAQTRYFGPRGNMAQKVSPQLTTRPTEVFRQASVTVAASSHAPTFPK